MFEHGASRHNDKRPGAGNWRKATGQVGVAQRTVASYEHYHEALDAVERLVEAGFPPERLAIVGCDLQLVERVDGRVPASSVAWRTALTGAVVGALSGWLLGLFSLVDPVVAALWLAFNGFLLGAVLGVLAGLIGYAGTGGRRAFTVSANVRAGRYDVLTDADVADQAVHMLRQRETETVAQTAPVATTDRAVSGR